MIIFPVNLFTLGGKDVPLSDEFCLSVSRASFLPGTGGPVIASDGSGWSMAGPSIDLYIAKE